MHHFHDARDWFFRHRYGLFLHWGLYAVGGLHEQELSRYGTPWEAYLCLLYTSPSPRDEQ